MSIYGTYLMENSNNYDLSSLYNNIMNEFNKFNAEIDITVLDEAVDFKKVKDVFNTIISKFIKLVKTAINKIKEIIKKIRSKNDKKIIKDIKEEEKRISEDDYGYFGSDKHKNLLDRLNIRINIWWNKTRKDFKIDIEDVNESFLNANDIKPEDFKNVTYIEFEYNSGKSVMSFIDEIERAFPELFNVDIEKMINNKETMISKRNKINEICDKYTEYRGEVIKFNIMKQSNNKSINVIDFEKGIENAEKLADKISYDIQKLNDSFLPKLDKIQSKLTDSEEIRNILTDYIRCINIITGFASSEVTRLTREVSYCDSLIATYRANLEDVYKHYKEA